MSYNPNFQWKQKTITIAVPTSSLPAGYQVKLTIPKETEMQSDFRDIRFETTDGYGLPYWVESIVSNTATVWVKLKDAVAAPTTVNIYMYYGNPYAPSASNGTNTFLSKADVGFDSNIGWTTVGNGVSINTSASRIDLNYSGQEGRIYTDAGVTDLGSGNWIFEAKWNYVVPSAFSAGIGITDYITRFEYTSGMAMYFQNPKRIMAVAGASYTQSSDSGATTGTYYIRGVRIGDTFYGYTYSDAARTSLVWSDSVTRSGITGLRYFHAVNNYYSTITQTGSIDSALVRKYVATEPATPTIGLTATDVIWNPQRKPITINNNSGGALTDYQVKLTTPFAPEMNNDFSDLRFVTDTGTVLNYWIESSTPGQTANIWIKTSLPNFGAGSGGNNVVYMHYGNPNLTSASNGVQTFLAFADFNSDEGFTIVNNGTAVAYGNSTGNIQTNNGRIDFVNMPMDSSLNYIYKDYGSSYFEDVTLEYNGMVTGHGVASIALTGFSNQVGIAPVANGVYTFESNYANDMGIYSWISSGSLNYTTPYIQTQENVNFYVKLDVKKSSGNSTISIYSDPQHTSLFTGAWSNPVTIATPSTGFRYFYPISGYNAVSGRSITGWLDNFRVRKYVATEPTFSIGSAEAMNVFSNRKTLTINNSSGAALTDYQVLITVTYASAMQANFNDIRFVDSSGNLLPYWIESKTDSSTANVWIKVNLPLYGTSPTGDNFVYMYYGNSSLTSASNGTNTFDFFDDFSGDLSKWTKTETTPGNITIVNGELKFKSGIPIADRIVAPSSTTIGIWEWKAKLGALNTNTAGRHSGFNPFFTNIGNQYFYTISGQENTVYLGKMVSSIQGNLIISAFTRDTSFHNMKIIRKNISGNFEIFIDGVSKGTVTDTSFTTNSYIAFSGFNDPTDEDNYFDDIRIRKYASPEPTVSIGSEQTPSGISATSMVITKSENPCRTGICTVTVDVIWTNGSLVPESFIPSIKINNVPAVVAPPLTSVTVDPSGTKYQQFIISGLPANTYSICPDPN